MRLASAREDRDHPREPSAVSGGWVLFLLVGGAISVPSVGLLGLLLPPGPGSLFLLLLLKTAVLVGLLLFVLRRSGASPADIGFRPVPRRWVAITAAVTLAMFPIVGAINWAVGRYVTGAPDTTQAESVAAVAFSPLAAVGLVLTAAVIVPVVEEVSFRAVLFGWLRWRWGRLVAYPLSAVVFAALHGIPAIVPAIAVFGLVLAYLYDASRSLWPGIAVHAAFNAINTIGLLIVLR